MKVRCRDLGSMDYETCWRLQQTLFDTMVSRKAGRSGTSPYTGAAPVPVSGTTTTGPGNNCAGTANAGAPESGHNTTAEASAIGAEDDAGTILLVEHPPVYTLGKSGHAENLLVSREALQAMGARFFHIDRGGDITFHGPGQLVCYPILDLERIGIGLRAYIEALEEAVIRTVARYGIAAGRIAAASGVWLGQGVTPGGTGRRRKICAIGVRSSRYVTMHGFALNVSTDLDWFSHINPCGFTDRGVTSIAQETARVVPMDEVKEHIARHLGETLGVLIEPDR